ncbi:MAG: hypothetical protein MZU91_04190 [Desulfosudis oleivorans]|nr:hypothetical protein [Desulfosudis oleivorans]
MKIIGKEASARELVEACVSEAITLGLFKVFTLTYKKDFFLKLGFKEIDRELASGKNLVGLFPLRQVS